MRKQGKVRVLKGDHWKGGKGSRSNSRYIILEGTKARVVSISETRRNAPSAKGASAKSYAKNLDSCLQNASRML